MSSKPALRSSCRTGTQPLHRRVAFSLNTCVIHQTSSWTCSDGTWQSLHIHAPWASSYFLHKLKETPEIENTSSHFISNCLLKNSQSMHLNVIGWFLTCTVSFKWTNQTYFTSSKASYSFKEWHQPPLSLPVRTTYKVATWISCQNQSGKTWKHVSHCEKPSSPCTCDYNNVHECSSFLSITMEPLSPPLPCPFISNRS